MANGDTLVKMRADIDQAEAAYGEFTRLVGSYYNGLIEAKVPHTLAEELTKEWHRLMVWKLQYPDAPPEGSIFL